MKSFRSQVVDDIFLFAKERNPFELIEKKYQALSRNTLASELVGVDIMPEIFEHDSSEEKLWSKFSDFALCKSLEFLGLNSEVLRTRGNSADVYSKGKNYTLVSDAKCFRLSRTAKNQKDFKIKALDDWRREDTYALLVSPLFQYPSDKSQIYSQAISHNVTLLSYLHLQFMLEKSADNNLENLWKLPQHIKNNYKKSEQERGSIYWKVADDFVCKITHQTLDSFEKYKKFEIEKTKEIGDEGVKYWREKILEFGNLNKEQAIALLIKSEKIEQKIETIEKTIRKLSA